MPRRASIQSRFAAARREAPVPLKAGGQLILHLLPLSAFTGPASIDIAKHYDSLVRRLPPLGGMGWNNRLNLDGHVNYTGGPEPSRAYTQLFRTGAVEVVNVLTQMQISSLHAEREIIQALPDYLRTLQDMEVEPPMYVFLSFVGVKGYTLYHRPDPFRESGQHPLDRNILALPEVVIDDYDAELAQVMRPAFDLVWNAFGFLHSVNYDDQGTWVGGR